MRHWVRHMHRTPHWVRQMHPMPHWGASPHHQPTRNRCTQRSAHPAPERSQCTQNIEAPSSSRSQCTQRARHPALPQPRYEAPLRFGGACQGIFPALTSTPEPSAQSNFGVPHARQGAMSPPGDEPKRRPSTPPPKRLLNNPPPLQIMPSISQRIVLIPRRSRQLRLPRILPPLPQIPGEPGQLPRQRRHRPPQLRQRHMVISREPGPQLDPPRRLPEELQQIRPDPLPAPPSRIRRRGQLGQHVLPHPSPGPPGVEISGHGIELASALVNDTDRHQVNRHAVLNKLGVVEKTHRGTLVGRYPAFVSGTRSASSALGWAGTAGFTPAASAASSSLALAA